MAHPVPDDVRAELYRQLAPYRRAYSRVRWTTPETWHLTLLFLGSVAPDRVPGLERLLADAARQITPYRVVIDKGDGRTRGREGVAWLGLSIGADALIKAATLSAEMCPPGIADGPPPKRAPSAHLTVARKAEEAVVQALRAQALGRLGVDWQVDRVQLVRSHLEPDGARYETLCEATL